MVVVLQFNFKNMLSFSTLKNINYISAHQQSISKLEENRTLLNRHLMNKDLLNTADTHPLLRRNPNCCRTPGLLKLVLSYSTVKRTSTEISCIQSIVQSEFWTELTLEVL